MSAIKLIKLLPVILVLCCMPGMKAHSQAGSLAKMTIVVQGAKHDTGMMMIAISDSEADYMTMGAAYMAGSVKVIGGKAVWVIDSIPYGHYALKVFHDENGNDSLDTKFMGIPAEPYGFSNNPKNKMGPASWKDASFPVDKPELEVIIDLK